MKCPNCTHEIFHLHEQKESRHYRCGKCKFEFNLQTIKEPTRNEFQILRSLAKEVVTSHAEFSLMSVRSKYDRDACPILLIDTKHRLEVAIEQLNASLHG